MAVPQYLSREGLDELVTLAAAQPPRPGATVKIQYKVTGGPAGDIDYYWVIDEGKILEAKLGTLDDVDFTMTQGYDDTAKDQRVELEATDVFMQGKMKVVGNMAKMMDLLPITNSPMCKA